MNATDNSKAGVPLEATVRAMLDRATRKEESPFDYIIVGSGAGGGPLACRLALAEKKVLLIEAGPDPKIAGVVHDAPLFHAASTEHPDLSWQFSVRHYEATQRQKDDQKYDAAHDKDNRTGGIFYPRSSGLGGCTSHHAMLVIRPNDKDWEHIADVTNDDSWRAKNMQPYFAKFEQCLYIDEYRGFLSSFLGLFSKAWFALVRLVNPKVEFDSGGHGFLGWQPTSFIAPDLVIKIVETDAEFTKVLIQAAFRVIKNNNRLTALLKRCLITLGFVRIFDPNDVSTRASSPAGGVFLIPTGIGGGAPKAGKVARLWRFLMPPRAGGSASKVGMIGRLWSFLMPPRAGGGEATDEAGKSLNGRRAGLREFILKTKNDHPDRLVIAEGVHVTRVLFDDRGPGKAPRAVGVMGIQGDYLYKASPRNQAATAKPVEYFVRHKRRDDEKDKSTVTVVGEVILSGGTFNTPQLLMLSGIGDEQQIQKINEQARENEKITFRVHLPGVGKNLQDRYEVGVVSQLRKPLVSLDTVAFIPGDPNDRVLQEWVQKKEGLYTTNGGTLAILQRSDGADGVEADLFTFGAPAAFRGYYWGWSKELLRATKGAAIEERDLWSWVILKAYTRNNGGTVQLRSADPFDTPVICFHSFDEGAIPDWEKDVKALAGAIESMRAINDATGSPFLRELQPKLYLEEKNQQRLKAKLPEWNLEDWIKNEAWGHHACGTCRMGSDPWKEKTANLTDKNAVLDSRFRVHGVEGLRVVDASIFPKIPGYFILAPIFMVSEKAAEVILRDQWEDNYPGEIRALEEQAIRNRRARAWVDHKNCLIPADKRPSVATSPRASANPNTILPEVEHSVGLAFSGGGVRSATFSLGVLQALARKDKLRHIDYLSSISGGGFTASFLGRLFTRERVAGVADPCGRAQDVLQHDNSGPLRWLRTQANYLFDAGTDDWLLALGIFFRNLITVHLVIGALLFAVFASLIGLSRLQLYQQVVPPAPMLPPSFHLILSPWWWFPVAVVGLVLFPMMLGYWLAPNRLSYRTSSPYALAGWLVLLAGATVGLAMPGGIIWAGAALAVLALAWLWQEAARQHLPDDAATNPSSVAEAVRNRLSRGLGETLVVFLASLAWVLLDSVAATAADPSRLPALVGALMALAPALQVLRAVAKNALPKGPGPGLLTILKIVAVVLAVALLFIVDLIAHNLFQVGSIWMHSGFIVVAFVFSVVIGPALDFLNFSSLHADYAAHITRTYLGASNEARTTSHDAVAANVQTALPGDDLPHCLYRPEENGGPLHLISMCVNETVDHASQREVRTRKGQLMTIGTFGVSVGRRYFAKWTKPCELLPRWMRFRRWLEGTDDARTPHLALEAIRLNADPDSFHPLARRDRQPAVVQGLTLGHWVAVSGAAFSTGRGRDTSPLVSLLAGLLNLRLGYWWNTGILAQERPGRFPPNLWVRLKGLPATLFRMQALLLSEWRGRFDGPSHEFWNLTDGGEQDNTGLYELIRRRVPFIIFVDAGQDLDYTFGDMATLERTVQIDFGVEFEWQSDATKTLASKHVLDWFDTAKVGRLQDLKGNRQRGGPGKTHAALARVKYANCPGHPDTWLLLIKPSLDGNEPLDIAQYAASHENFPQDSTGEQTYSEDQWESYRMLGYMAAINLIK